MELALILAAWMHGAMGLPQWAIVRQDGSLAAGTGSASVALQTTSVADLRSLWVWSQTHAPREFKGRGAVEEAKAPLGAEGPSWLQLEVHGSDPASLRGARLIAAPVKMWQELPEAALPVWPVPSTGRIVVPVDLQHTWRVRVITRAGGSWWSDVRADQEKASISPMRAPGVEVSVLLPDGRPARTAHARVGDPNERSREFGAWALTRGNEGKLRVPGLPDRQEIFLMVLEAGYPPLIIRGWPSTLPRVVTLQPGAEIAGRLTDGKGQPISGAKVEIETWQGQLPQLMRVQEETKTDGRFTIGGVRSGQVSLTVRAAGYVPLLEKVELSPGEHRDIGARVLERGERLSIIVRDERGQLIEGAHVEAGAGIWTTTAADGSGVLVGVPRAPIEVSATAFGHLPSSRRVQPPFSQPITIEMRSGVVVRGRLLDTAGIPVSVGMARLDSASCQNEGSLDADGRFSLDLQAGKEATLVLRSPTTRELRVPLAAGTAGEVRDVGDLSAPAGPTVTGLIVNSQGDPIPGARVWVPRPGPEGFAVAWGTHDLIETATNEDGRFHLFGLSEGPATLRIEAAGYARATIQVALPAASADQGVDTGTTYMNAGAVVRVHVDPAKAELIAEGDALARVDLRRHWSIADMLTAQVWNGEAEVPNVPSGPAIVSVARGRHVVCEKSVNVPDDGGSLDVDCGSGSLVVTGQVLVGGTAAGPGALTWLPTAGEFARIDTRVSPTGLRQQQTFGGGRPQVDVPLAGDNGGFMTQDLSPGSWNVFFQPEGGSPTSSLRIDIPEGSERFEAKLPFGGTNLTGVVVTDAGNPAADALVREVNTGAFALSKSDGSFVLSGLHPGKAAVAARLGDLRSAVVSVPVSADQVSDPLRLVVRDSLPSQVAITVLDQAGRPAPGAFVFFEEQGRGVRLLTTDASGTATAVLEPPFAPRLRAAAFARGVFTFGDWMTFNENQGDEAPRSMNLQLVATGGVLVRTTRLEGSPQIASEAGWNITWLLRLLGVNPQVTLNQPLELDGLPLGLYTARLETSTVTLEVSEGSVKEGAFE